MLGGVFWVIKGASILATGIQPPLLFEVAPLLFSAGLVGLHARLTGSRGLSARSGLILAVLSGGLAALGVLLPAGPGDESFSPWIFGSFVTNLAGLILLGLCTTRSPGTMPEKMRRLPLILGIATFPLIILGGGLESINERLLELPIVLLGLAWIGLGYLITTHEDQESSPHAA